jgi:hypothetical protein
VDKKIKSKKINYWICQNGEDQYHYHIFRYINCEHDTSFYCFIYGKSPITAKRKAEKICKLLNGEK